MSIARKILMGSSGGKKSTYVDDVFSTYAYLGNGSNRSIVNGVDNTKGGLVWTKARTANYDNILVDTERGTNKYLKSNSSDSEVTDAVLTSFNNNGYGLSGSADVNRHSNYPFVGWNFRKAKGFCDIVTYTGTGSARTIPHNLGSVPGFIIVKQTSTAANWTIYHRDNGNSKAMYFTTAGLYNDPAWWNSTDPTASVFSLGNSDNTNKNGETYVAYIFAGGASTAATARPVDFNGSSQSLHMAASTSSMDFASSGQFTIEFFVKLNTLNNNNKSYQTMVGRWVGSTGYSWLIDTNKNDGDVNLYLGDGTTNYYASIHAPDGTLTAGQWYHIAVVKNGTTGTIFVDGIPKVSSSSWTQGSTNNSTIVQVANNNSSFGSALDGQISNFRVTNGQALYTAAFKPPTEPLTTTSQGATASNVKILMCQDTNPTVGAVTTGTITNNGSATGSTDSPFDDPESFKFGEEGDQNIIKCGSYTTNSNEDADVYLGWEPSWVLVKRTDGSSGGADWMIVDSIRGFPNAQDIEANTGDCEVLAPNLNDAENNTHRLGLTSTGFYADQYGPNRTFIYMAIRRPDPLVGKPVEVGTDAFNVVYGNSSSTIPNFPSNFTVGMGIYKQPLTAYSWYLHTRLTGGKALITDSNSAQSAGTDADATFDANAGWGKFGYNTDKASWMWKRHAGFDVVTYKGNSTAGHQISHSLSKPPEMIWCKLRGGTEDWFVYHKSLNGGSSPENYAVKLNLSNAEFDFDGAWNDTAPTSTTFTLGSDGGTNANNGAFLAMLFASVDGISSVGSYSPTSASTTVTCGFQPRFVVVKAATKNNTWSVADSLRGITAGNDPALALNENWENDKYGGADWIDVSATGFTVNSAGGAGTADANSNGETYIYYAHA